jgi:hypothetical protein
MTTDETDKDTPGHEIVEWHGRAESLGADWHEIADLPGLWPDETIESPGKPRLVSTPGGTYSTHCGHCGAAVESIDGWKLSPCGHSAMHRRYEKISGPPVGRMKDPSEQRIPMAPSKRSRSLSETSKRALARRIDALNKENARLRDEIARLSDELAQHLDDDDDHDGFSWTGIDDDECDDDDSVMTMAPEPEPESDWERKLRETSWRAPIADEVRGIFGVGITSADEVRHIFGSISASGM